MPSSSIPTPPRHPRRPRTRPLRAASTGPQTPRIERLGSSTPFPNSRLCPLRLRRHPRPAHRLALRSHAMSADPAQPPSSRDAPLGDVMRGSAPTRCQRPPSRRPAPTAARLLQARHADRFASLRRRAGPGRNQPGERLIDRGPPPPDAPRSTPGAHQPGLRRTLAAAPPSLRRLRGSALTAHRRRDSPGVQWRSLRQVCCDRAMPAFTVVSRWRDPIL